MTGIPHFGLTRQYNLLREELLDASDQVLKSGILVNGPFTEQFENWLAKKTKCKYATTVHSGTQALEFIAKYEKYSLRDLFLDVPTVLIPNLTYPATVNAFLNAGFNIQLCDTDNTGLMVITDEDKKQILTDVFYYICLVGLYGALPKAFNKFDIFFRKENVFIDGAQHWPIQHVNPNGIAMAISFDPTKVLPASGNGGAVVTNKKELYDFVKNYKNNDVLGDHKMTGTNSKMSEQDCAHLLVRTKYFKDWQKRRMQIRQYYIEKLSNLPIRLLSKDFKFHADQKFVIYTEHRDNLQYFLKQEGIETKVHYKRALSQLPIAANFIKPDILSTSVMLTRGLLSLPIYPELTDSEVEYITDRVIKFFTFC